MPSIATIGGKKFPTGKVAEYVYGKLTDEKLDFIAPSPTSDKRIAIVHIHGGAWVAGSKGKFYSKPLLKFSAMGYPVFKACSHMTAKAQPAKPTLAATSSMPRHRATIVILRS
ncbi:MAG: hypothetical protein ACKV1O_24660 [Saprospiraceae bacterium]